MTNAQEGRSSEKQTNGEEKFDPLAMMLLEQNLRQALEDQKRKAFPPPEQFSGAGVYALYYKGDFELYRPLKEEGIPIYVGKAEAGNSSYGNASEDHLPKLYDRIVKNHAKSVKEVADGGGNLQLSDFEVKYLRLDDVWVVLAERALLRAYAPVLWNTVMPGFGANPPGAARKNARSVWDTIHPGRPRAGELCNRSATRKEMISLISRSVAASMMKPGAARDKALSSIRDEKKSIIWSEPKKGGKSDKIRVFRVPEFLEENAAIGRVLRPDEWVDVTGQSVDITPDPEEAASRNTLDAERYEEGLMDS